MLTRYNLVAVNPHDALPKLDKVYVVEKSPFSKMEYTVYGSFLKVLAARYDVTTIRSQSILVEFRDVQVIVRTIHLKQVRVFVNS